MNKMYDIIIIGAGPAGMTAGIYAKRANLNVAILEKSAPGGQILNTAEVENYTGFKKQSGFDLAMQMYEHTLSLGITTIFEEAIEINNKQDYFEITTPKQLINSKTILITTGAIPRRLNVDNEDRFASNGISWCAICDGPLYKDKEVVVIGGGNSAVEEALFLSNLASKVSIVQNLPNLTADEKSIKLLLKQENVSIHYNSKVVSFIGDTNLEGVLVEDDNKQFIIKCDGVFEYIGLSPETRIFEKLGILDKQGYIKANEKMETKVPGIYSAGDVNAKQIRQIVTAVSDGAIAIQNIISYLENKKE